VAALRGENRPRSVAAVGAQRVAYEPLVVADLGLVEGVGVGGVEQVDPGVECRRDRLVGQPALAPAAERQRHAAEPDAGQRRVAEGRHGG
jgi:hypothetical protein